MSAKFWIAGLASALVLAAAPNADAQTRLYRGVPTSCPYGTVPVPETDNCIPERRAAPAPRPALTLKCYFTSGPRRGQIVNYASLGLKPIPIGSPCNDGVASQGVGTR